MDPVMKSCLPLVSMRPPHNEDSTTLLPAPRSTCCAPSDKGYVAVDGRIYVPRRWVSNGLLRGLRNRSRAPSVGHDDGAPRSRQRQ